jgi:hypothetical protein
MVTRKNAENTRGRPFEPGNPGRPLGARNRASVILDWIGAEAASDILQAVIEQAKDGDVAAAKIVLDRLWPPPKGRALAFELPAVAGLADIKNAHTAILVAVATGSVTPDEASTVASVLESSRRAIETVELEARVTALEARSQTR